MNVKQKALEIGLSEKQFTGLIATFIRQTTEDLEQMDKAIQDNNRDTVRQLAHHIKGAAASLEIDRISTAALELENCAREGGEVRMHELLDVLKQSFSAFKPSFELPVEGSDSPNRG